MMKRFGAALALLALMISLGALAEDVEPVLVSEETQAEATVQAEEAPALPPEVPAEVPQPEPVSDTAAIEAPTAAETDSAYTEWVALLPEEDASEAAEEAEPVPEAAAEILPTEAPTETIETPAPEAAPLTGALRLGEEKKSEFADAAFLQRWQLEVRESGAYQLAVKGIALRIRLEDAEGKTLRELTSPKTQGEAQNDFRLNLVSGSYVLTVAGEEAGAYSLLLEAPPAEDEAAEEAAEAPQADETEAGEAAPTGNVETPVEGSEPLTAAELATPVQAIEDVPDAAEAPAVEQPVSGVQVEISIEIVADNSAAEEAEAQPIDETSAEDTEAQPADETSAEDAEAQPEGDVPAEDGEAGNAEEAAPSEAESTASDAEAPAVASDESAETAAEPDAETSAEDEDTSADAQADAPATENAEEQPASGEDGTAAEEAAPAGEGEAEETEALPQEEPAETVRPLVRLTSTLDPQVKASLGDEVVLTVTVENMTTPYAIEWQYSPDGGQTIYTVENVDGEVFSYRLSEENRSYSWRAVVRPISTEAAEDNN